MIFFRALYAMDYDVRGWMCEERAITTTVTSLRFINRELIASTSREHCAAIRLRYGDVQCGVTMRASYARI